jgi:hypothetical protein
MGVRRNLFRRPWAAAAALAVALSLLASGCTLYANRQFVVQAGTTGIYAYIGTNPSSQIQDVYTATCRGDPTCALTIMTRINIHGSATVRNAWYTAWTNYYSKGEALYMLQQIAYNRWVSGGQRNTCLVLVKPTIPWVGPGGVIPYRWQTRALGHDGCVTGWFAGLDRPAGKSLRFDAPVGAADRQKSFCAPLTTQVGGTDPAGSLARRMISESSLTNGRSGGQSLSSMTLAIAPGAVKAAAGRLAHAIELGRAGAGVSVLKRPGANAAIGQVDNWATAHC